MRLGSLKVGVFARIIGIGEGAEGEGSEIISRLLEMGFLEGSRLEVIHEAPFGGDPIAVRVRGALIALRRNEANLIRVSLDFSAEASEGEKPERICL